MHCTFKRKKQQSSSRLALIFSHPLPVERYQINSNTTSWVNYGVSVKCILKKIHCVTMELSILKSGHRYISPLAPVRFKSNFSKVIFKLILVINGCFFLWNCAKMNATDNNKPTLIQVMAWCLQATSHYLRQCWPRSMSLYGITTPQWVNDFLFFFFFFKWLPQRFTFCGLVTPWDIRQIEWTLLQVMAWHLLGAKPLPEPMLTYHQLHPQEQTSKKSESKYKTFHSQKCISKRRLQNGGHVVQVSLG